MGWWEDITEVMIVEELGQSAQALAVCGGCNSMELSYDWRPEGRDRWRLAAARSLRTHHNRSSLSNYCPGGRRDQAKGSRRRETRSALTKKSRSGGGNGYDSSGLDCFSGGRRCLGRRARVVKVGTSDPDEEKLEGRVRFKGNTGAVECRENETIRIIIGIRRGGSRARKAREANQHPN